MLVKALLLAAAAALINNPTLADWKDCLDVRSATKTAYIVTTGDTHSSCGDMDAELQAEVRATGDESVWFRLDDETWVVRDRAVVAQAQRLFDKVNEIGAKQGAIGAKQGRIGAEQGQLGAQQAADALSGLYGASRKDTDAEREARSARMRELGERMSVLGEQQSALGDQMKREVDLAQEGLSRLLAKAITDGTAVRVRRL